MLESTIWRQYHSDNSFRGFLGKHCVLDVDNLIQDDKKLYGVLKSKLTKKELKLFAMDCAEISDEELKADFSYDDDALQQAKFKLYKKLKQDKTRLSFRFSAGE